LANTETIEFAKVAELLAPAEGTKEVYLKTLKKKVRIKKINIGDLADILKASAGNDVLQFVYLCFKGLKEPSITLDQARKLPLKVVMELSVEIAKFSELDKAGLDQIRNLLGAESPEQSSK